VCLRPGLLGRGQKPVGMIITVSPCQGRAPRPENVWSVHDTGAWNRDKEWGWSPGPSKSSRMLTLNEIEGEMAVANAWVNELVSLQADMLLKAADVESSCRY